MLGDLKDITTTTPVDLVACPDCGAPASISWSSEVMSTSGAIVHVKVHCANRHWFLMPADLLESL